MKMINSIFMLAVFIIILFYESHLVFIWEYLKYLKESNHKNCGKIQPFLSRCWPYAAIFLICYWLHKLIFKPVDRKKNLSDIGWNHLESDGSWNRRSKTELIRQVQRQRKIGNLPPVYPNGWFAIEESRNLANGQVKSVHCLGQDLAVFRSDDGIAHVLDAYCPHLGANMAVGGAVKGNCLECPFHGWQFDGENGICSKIPYAKKVPDFAKVKKWTSEERNGSIYLWFDIENQPPLWQIPIIQPIDKGQYYYRGRTEHHVSAHIQEIPENGSDIAHLGHVHVPNILKGANLFKAFTPNKLLDFASHDWTGNWEPLKAPLGHVAEVKIQHAITFFGGIFKMLSMAVDIKQIGPGIVHLQFDTFFGKGVLVQTVTPQEPLHQKIVHQFYTSSTFFAPFANLCIMGEAFHVERDIMVWNSKQYLSKPTLVSEDKLVARFRRWYSQFYSENSPKFESFRKEDLQW